MRRYEVTFMSTKVDTQHERATKAALESAARQINACYVRVGRGHDPRYPPLGRIVGAKVESMGDGHFALNGELEVWDEGDQPNALVGDGRSLAQAADPEHTFDVLYDLPSAVDIGIPFLRELAALAGSDAAPRYQAKKAVEPLSALVIAVGVFTVGAIARGFLRKLGEDLYEKLKEKLKAAAKPRPGRERLLAIQVAVVAADGRRVLVEVVLTDPTEADVETLLTSGLKKLDAVVARTIAENPTAVEVVAELIHGDVRVLYWIRSDGVPSVIKSVPHQELIAQGLSIGAIIDDTEPRE